MEELLNQQAEPSGGVTASPEQDVQPTDSVTVDTPTDEKPQDMDKNRWFEIQRKLENKLSETVEEKLTQVLSKVQNNQVAQPKYSIDELERFAEETDSDGHRRWAKQEIRKLQQEEQAGLVRKELQTWQQQQQAQQLEQRSFQEVVTRHPDLVIKDSAGNILGWNQNSPLVQSMSRYLSDPRVSGQPDKFLIAEKFALADMYLAQRPKVQKEIASQKEEIKNLQKRTLVEAGNNQEGYIPSPEASAMERLTKTGSITDAVNVLKARRSK
jgi:hypothetical protein